MNLTKVLYSFCLIFLIGGLGMTLDAQNSVLQSANDVEKAPFDMQSSESETKEVNAAAENAKTATLSTISERIAAIKAGSDTNKFGENAIEKLMKDLSLPEGDLTNLSAAELDIVSDFVDSFNPSDVSELNLFKAYKRLLIALK